MTNRKTKMGKYLSLLLMAAFYFSVSGLAIAEADGRKGIARLEALKGELRIKSLGSWGANVSAGSRLYHGDKFLTGDESRVRIVFKDGAVLNGGPNALFRIAENQISQGPAEPNPVKRREIRVLLGKVCYQAGPGKQMPVVLIASEAAVAFQGKEFCFGTDGRHAFIQGNESDMEKSGNVSLEDVPDSTPALAAADPNYRLALTSIEAWENYEVKLNKLLKEKEIKDRAGLFQEEEIAKSFLGKSDADKALYKSIRGELTQYAAESVRENMAENEALMLNPDPLVATRAESALDGSKRFLSQIQDRMIFSLSLDQKLQDMEAQQDKIEGAKLKEAAYAKLLHTNFESSMVSEKSALTQMMASELHTIGLHQESQDLDEILELSESVFSQAKAGYEKTETFAARILKGESTDLVTLKQAEMAAKTVNANDGLASVLVTEAESLITQDEAATQEIRQERKKVSTTRNRVSLMVNASLTAPEAGQEMEKLLEMDEKAIEESTAEIEASTQKVARVIPEKLQRESIGSPVTPDVVPQPDAEEIVSVPITDEVREADEQSEQERVKDRDGDGWTPDQGDKDDLDPDIHGYHQ